MQCYKIQILYRNGYTLKLKPNQFCFDMSLTIRLINYSIFFTFTEKVWKLTYLMSNIINRLIILWITLKYFEIEIFLNSLKYWQNKVLVIVVGKQIAFEYVCSVF